MKRFLSEIGVRRDVNWRVKDSPLLLRLLLFNNSIIICREREREREKERERERERESIPFSER